MPCTLPIAATTHALHPFANEILYHNFRAKKSNRCVKRQSSVEFNRATSGRTLVLHAYLKRERDDELKSLISE